MTGTELDLSGKIGGHRPTTHRVVIELMRVLTNLSINKNSIKGKAAGQLATAALRSSTLEVLSGVPIKKLREDKQGTRLDLSRYVRRTS